MFTRNQDGAFGQLLAGIDLKTRAHGEKTLLGEFRLQKGAVVPGHAHPHEQTGYLVSGHLRFEMEGATVDAHPGDCWCIPGGVTHAALAVEDSVAIEVFSPVREDYLSF